MNIFIVKSKIFAKRTYLPELTISPAISSEFLLTYSSRLLKILGNVVKITIEVIIPAIKSAIPSEA